MSKKKCSFFQSNLAIVTTLLILVFIFFSVFAKGFFSVINMNNLLTQITIIGIVAVGQTLLIVSGCIDLAQGKTIGLCTIIASMLVSSDYAAMPWWVSIFACILVALVVNALTGALTAYVKLPAFIVTLGCSQALYAMALMTTNGKSIHSLPKDFSKIATAKIGGVVPIMVLVTIAVIIIGYILLAKTAFGRKIYATGSNTAAAKFSGVPTEKVRFIAYLINGVLIGIAAFIMLCRVNGGIASNGANYEMNAIAGAVIGGGSLDGGKGSIIGAIMGTALMIVMTNGLQVWGVSSYIQQFIMGVILIFAVYMDTVRSRKALA